MFQGTIGDYEWIEWRKENEDIRVPDIVSHLKQILKGLYALNTSFDSGLFIPKESDLQAGWSQIGKQAISPQLTDSLLDRFPNEKYFHDCGGFEEWYFFRQHPLEVPTRGFCNWVANTMENHGDVKFSHDFEGDIHRCQPELVIGEGYTLYLIYKPIFREEIFKNLRKEKK